METKFCPVAPKIWGYAVRNLLHVALLAPGILRRLPYFRNICTPPVFIIGTCPVSMNLRLLNLLKHKISLEIQKCLMLFGEILSVAQNQQHSPRSNELGGGFFVTQEQILLTAPSARFGFNLLATWHTINIKGKVIPLRPREWVEV